MAYNYSNREIRMEQEANYFAICLLMPKEMFLAEWKKLRDAGVDEDNQLLKLSDIFCVPISACAIRMADLGENFLANVI